MIALPPRLRAWRNMASSATLARVAPSRVPRPHVAYVFPTFRCGLDCASCGASGLVRGEELTASEWRALFRDLAPLDLLKVLGGEPFVRPDLGRILEDARRILDPYVLQITTNGFHTEALLDTAARVGWPGLHLRVSLDGFGETHDRSRGLAGSFDAAVRSLEGLAPIRDRTGLRVGINFTLTDDSLPDLDALLAFAARLGADVVPGIHFSPFLAGRTDPASEDWRFVRLTDPARALAVWRDRRTGLGRALPGVDRLASRFLAGGAFSRAVRDGARPFPCRQVRDLAHVLPDGRVVVCGADHTTLGSVRDTPFPTIWSGEAARAARAKVDACPGCLHASVEILSRLYAGRPFSGRREATRRQGTGDH